MTPTDLKRLAFYLDGLRYSLLMSAISARRLPITLETVAETARQGGHDEQEIASVLLDAWAIVDMCHRVRELVQELPGLKKSTPAIQLFLRKTAAVEDLRNHVQHFRSGIHKTPDPTAPLWGSIAWVPESEPTVCYSIFTGNLVEGLQVHSISYDTHNFCFTAMIELRTEAATVDLYSIWLAVEEVGEELKGWAAAHPVITTDGPPLGMVCRISFERGENEQLTITTTRT